MLEEIEKKFTYGSHENIPFRYVGLNLKEEDGSLIIDQDHFVESIEAPNLHGISSLRKSDLLDENMQTQFRSLVSKLNILSFSSGPDISYGENTDDKIW